MKEYNMAQPVVDLYERLHAVREMYKLEHPFSIAFEKQLIHFALEENGIVVPTSAIALALGGAGKHYALIGRDANMVAIVTLPRPVPYTVTLHYYGAAKPIFDIGRKRFGGDDTLRSVMLNDIPAELLNRSLV